MDEHPAPHPRPDRDPADRRAPDRDAQTDAGPAPDHDARADAGPPLNRDARADAGPPPDADGSPAELGPLAATMREVDRLMAHAVRQVAALDARRAAKEEGLPVDTALLLHTGWTRADIRMLQTTTDLLARLPAAACLFESGILSWGHVRQLILGVRRFPTDQLESLDRYLDTHRDRLAALDPDQRTWALEDAIDEHTATATLAGRDDRAPEQDRLVFAPRLDGSGSGFFDLHAEAFTAVTDRLHAEADAPRATPSPLEEGSDAAPESPPDPRSKQLADALVRLCSRAADGGPVRPTRATVTIDVARVTDRFAGELRPALAARPPRIVRRAIDRLTCDADLDIVLRHGTDLLAAKRTQPSVPTDVRRAVAARDGGCRFPGCRAPVSWCDVHHVIEQARDGDHSLANLVLLCRRHHTVVHRQGWRQTLRPDGRYTISRRHRTWTTLPRVDQQLPPPDTRAGPASPARDGPDRGTAPPTDDDVPVPF